MDNLKSPASPTIYSINHGESVEVKTDKEGFTKLELASLMIAQGLVSQVRDPYNSISFAGECTKIAKDILEEANK